MPLHFTTYANILRDQSVIKLPHLSCFRCLHTWVPRTDKLPRVCPKCKSPYWEKERRTLKK